ncbi:hypothetical protein, partial [Nocardia gipuzkoensis]|uniref:hypothetical protein n=1 Tax=Nocardia gipuzkoensis TaxID=2749991 RepID=UPI002458DF3F
PLKRLPPHPLNRQPHPPPPPPPFGGGAECFRPSSSWFYRASAGRRERGALGDGFAVDKGGRSQ